MILIGNQGSGNYKDLDKTRVKLFPNFTRHHLITHTNMLFKITTQKMKEEKREQSRDLHDDIRGGLPIPFLTPHNRA